jgi:hypothetical protein
VRFGQLHGTINDPRSHHDNPILRLEMAFERADRSRCIVFGNLTYTGLTRNSGYDFYTGNVRSKNVVACLGLGQAPDLSSSCFISITLDESTTIEIVGSHQRRSSMITSERGLP